MKEATEKMRVFDTKENHLDLVTETDREIEKLLVEGLKAQFPSHVYIGEEGTKGTSSGQKLTDQPTWIIDPIDGTTNFVHGFHYACISVGFWLNKQPELAICLNPLLDMEFKARRNCGAYLNEAPIRASGQTDLERALVINEMNPANLEPQLMAIQIGNAEKMLNKVHT